MLYFFNAIRFSFIYRSTLPSAAHLMSHHHHPIGGGAIGTVPIGLPPIAHNYSRSMNAAISSPPTSGAMMSHQQQQQHQLMSGGSFGQQQNPNAIAGKNAD